MTAQPIEEPRGLVPASDLYKAWQRIDALEAELAALKGNVRANEKRDLTLQLALKCSKSEANILDYLLSHENCVKESMHFFLYQDDEYAPELKIIDVFICKLRGKLQKAGAPGCTIETIWGQGYRLTAEGRAWLQGIASSDNPPKAASGHPGAITGMSGGER